MEEAANPAPGKLTARNVVLVGFMGSGKSSVGRLVADSLGLTLVDTDSLIETKAGCSIPDIFATEGEEGFRQRETAVLSDLQDVTDHVISTGGGIVTRPENLLLLENLGFVVWLDSDEEVLWRRVRRNANRPLLRTSQPRETIRDLLAQRRPLYEQVADFRVDSSHLSLKETAYGVAESARHFFSGTSG